MIFKGLFQHFRFRVHHRKIELQNQVAVPFRRRVAANVKPSEQLLELVLRRNVVIGSKHRQPQRFPETPGTYQKQEIRTFLYLPDKTGLIDIIKIFSRKQTEVTYCPAFIFYDLIFILLHKGKQFQRNSILHKAYYA